MQETVIDHRVKVLEDSFIEVKTAIRSIDASLQTFSKLEMKLEIVLESIKELKEDHEKRIRTIENDLPTLRMIRNWVIAGVVGCVSLLGILTFNVVTAGVV